MRVGAFAITATGVLLVSYFYSSQFQHRARAIEESHLSMYDSNNTDFFASSLKPFADTKPLTPPPHVYIVNQHILAASLIAHQFTLSADPSVTTVVLITQNNWDAGEAPVITSQERWHTPLGDIEPDTKLTEALIAAKVVSPEEAIFTHEHGITGIVPYVAHAYPNARIVPLVIRDKTPDAALDALAEHLEVLDLTHTAVIATIDMSHYLPVYLAPSRSGLRLLAQNCFALLCRGWESNPRP